MGVKDLFGFIFDKKDKKPEEVTQKKSFVPPDNEDGSVVIEANSSGAGFSAQYIDMDGTTRNDVDLIQKYREMAMHPEVETAIEDIVTETIVGEENEAPVKIVLDDLEISDPIKEKISKEFDEVLTLLNFYTKGYEIFRRWYVDGRIVYHVIIDEKDKKGGIAELRYVDPVNIQKIRIFKKNTEPNGAKIIVGSEEYYVYNKDGFKQGAAQGLKISTDAICYIPSGLYDSRNKRSIGYLHKVIKPLNQLRMMEDAVVIYRISRAPERRIFYIDVGNLPKLKAEQYMRDLMQRYRNKLMYDASTGEVRDDRRYMSMLEDYWLPRREGGRGTQIETLKGGENLSELGDVEYFLKKLYKALNVPISRMQSEQKSFSIGKSTEISRDEVKFSKFITRLRFKFSELFYELLRTQLITKNIITAEDWEKYKSKIHFDFLKDNYFAELKQAEINRQRVELVAEVNNFVGQYYSEEWIMSNILKFNDAEIKLMRQQMQEEDKVKHTKEKEKLIKQAELNLLQAELAPEQEMGGEDPMAGGGQSTPPPSQNTVNKDKKQ